MTRSASSDGLAIIKQFEGCAKKLPDGRFSAYPDPGTGAEPWTIGWGATGPGITKGVIWTAAQCDARLIEDVARFSGAIDRALGDAPTSQAQFDAMVSFHYNTGKLLASTLFRLHKAGDYAGAAREFGKWVNAAGKPLPGLVKRRASEAALYGRAG